MNWSMEYNVAKLVNKIDIAEKYAFFSAIVVGILTHGFVLYNKISYLDDNRFYFSLGGTYPWGRWGLGLIEDVQKRLHLQNYSMPITNGLLSILFIALTALILIRALNIQNKAVASLIGMYMVIFPVVTSTFSFMFTAPYYFFACLIMVVAVYMVYKSNYGIVPAAILIAFGMGIYQAYVGMATAVFVITLIVDAKENDFWTNVKKAVRCLISLVLGIVMYFALNKVFLSMKEIALTGYQGISEISNLSGFSLDGLLGGIKNAYLFLYQMTVVDNMGLSNAQGIRLLYKICLILIIVMAIMCVHAMWKKQGMWNGLYLSVLFLLVPLSIGVVYVMTIFPGSIIHTVMVYSFVMIPIYPLVLSEMMDSKEFKVDIKGIRVWLRNIAVLTIFAMSVYYFCVDNIAYLKVDLQQENAVSYYTTMITRIKSVDNYSDELPVVFLGNVDGQDSSIEKRKEFDNIKMKGYSLDTNEFMAYYASDKFWELHCGYTYTKPENKKEIGELEYVKAMPCYPHAGSIQVVNGVVVVKFSDYY